MGGEVPEGLVDPARLPVRHPVGDRQRDRRHQHRHQPDQAHHQIGRGLAGGRGHRQLAERILPGGDEQRPAGLWIVGHLPTVDEGHGDGILAGDGVEVLRGGLQTARLPEGHRHQHPRGQSLGLLLVDLPDEVGRHRAQHHGQHQHRDHSHSQRGREESLIHAQEPSAVSGSRPGLPRWAPPPVGTPPPARCRWWARAPHRRRPVCGAGPTRACRGSWSRRTTRRARSPS